MASQLAEQSARRAKEFGEPHARRSPRRQALPSPHPSDQKGLSYLDAELVQELRRSLRAQTPDCVMDTFGISMNTWVKLRDGKPIRTSVAQRLVERLKHVL
jgi:hypothetical protein